MYTQTGKDWMLWAHSTDANLLTSGPESEILLIFLMFKCHFGDIPSQNQERTLGGLAMNILKEYLRPLGLQKSR